MNESTKYKFGDVYFFKDDSFKKIDLTIQKDNLIQLKNAINYDINVDMLADEELGNALDTIESRSVSIEDIYLPYINQNIAILRIAKETIFKGNNIDFGEHKINVILPKNISVSTRSSVEKLINQHGTTMNKNNIKIHSIESFGHGEHFEYYDNSMSNTNILNMLVLYLKDKSKELNIDDRMMFNTYRTFGLDRTLLRDDSNAVINNRNTAVIVIGTNNIFKQPLRSSDIREEALKVFKSIEPKLSLAKKSLNGIIIYTRAIIVELKNYEVIISLPGTKEDILLSAYQIKELRQVLNQINEIMEREKGFMKPKFTFYALHIFGEHYTDKLVIASSIQELMPLLKDMNDE